MPCKPLVRLRRRVALLVPIGCVLAVTGCAPQHGHSAADTRAAIRNYTAARRESVAHRHGLSSRCYSRVASQPCFTRAAWNPRDPRPPASELPQSQPTTEPLRDDYWQPSLWKQVRHESADFARRGFWEGFKSTYWNLHNAFTLTAAMGASITLRETGVDRTVRNRTRGQRQLGDLDEPVQLLGNPATHFAGAGALWLTSTLTQDKKQHEFAQSLTQALAVNGASTLILKTATNTRAPDGDSRAWPSGHTSSAFTFAAVVHEYYGPWWGVPSFLLAGLVGYERIDARQHDLSDVVFGAVLGYVVGTSIARENQEDYPQLFGMRVLPFVDPQTGAAGIALMKQW